MWYSRRYRSFSRLFIADRRLSSAGARSLDLLFREVARLRRPDPRRGGRAELDDEVEVRADQGHDQPRDEQHVDRVEPAQRGGAELRAAAQEVRQVRAERKSVV